MGQTEVVCHATGAMNLNCPVDDGLRHLRCDHLDHGNLGTGFLVADCIHHVSSVECQQSGLIDFHA